jgi:hypothetical protein
MAFLDSWKALQNTQGGNIKDSLKNSLKTTLSKSFKDSPSYYSVFLNGVTTDVHITDDSEIREQKNILTQNTSLIKSGDVVLWNSENWLMLIVDDMSGVYYRGMIRKCVSSLKWKNSSGVQKEAYFTFSSTTSSNFGVEEGRVVNLGNERRQIIIQSNVDTQLIKKDQRFIFDNRAWKCTVVDGLNTGLIYLTLEEDTTNTATDDITNRIANNTGASGGGFW